MIEPTGMTRKESRVIVSGPFDDLRSPLVRFLQQAARSGPVRLLCWSDEAIQLNLGREPNFPLSERLYFLQALRYVDEIEVVRSIGNPHVLPGWAYQGGEKWAVRADEDCPEKRLFCQAAGLIYQVISDQEIPGFQFDLPLPVNDTEKRVVVTGSFDWLHSGHIRFFEEVAAHGKLIVIVGHDDNIRLLKGPGHPLLKQEERLFMVQSIRYVSQAMISSGHGWLDAEPELQRLRPDFYAVNEEGDKPEKRAYCQAHGITYLVLKRIPKEGLPRRSSTELRGF